MAAPRPSSASAASTAAVGGPQGVDRFATTQGDDALWIVVAAVAIYLVAYRYYSLFIASKVMQLDPNRATPAVLN
ncbi:carbon starvation protein A, partial [Pseudomonas aeruginosa]|nr:carbon starvation protein A [Pseudomonas aeruginosa]